MKEDMLGGEAPVTEEDMPMEQDTAPEGEMGQGPMEPGADAGMAPEQPQEGALGPDDETLRQNVLEHIASLTDEQKNWIQANLTPETWAMLTLITGRAVGEALRPFVDESVILVPMDRAEFQKMYQQGQQEEGQAPTEGQQPSPQPQPQQSPATAPMSAPVQQPNAPAATLS